MRSRTTTLVLCALALSVVPSTAFADAEGATIDKTGWWNRAQTTAPTPAGPVTVPPPPGIPEGDLAVGAVGSEPSAILAVGIQPDDGPGATVERFTMRLTEDPDAEANQGTDGAALLACPITDFWAGGENSDYETRPAFDCDVAAVSGVRGDDGVWEFDLAPIGEVWFDTFGTVLADGVVVVPDLDETSPFQAVFKGGDDIDIVLESTPAPDAEENPFAIPDPPSDAGFSSGGSAGGGGSSIFSPPVVTTPPDTSFDAPAPDQEPAGDATTGDDTAAPPLADAPAAEPVASRAGDLAGNLSPLVLFGLLAIAGLFVATSYWFGPAGQPVTTIRQRGVSRALAARERATKGT